MKKYEMDYFKSLPQEEKALTLLNNSDQEYTLQCISPDFKSLFSNKQRFKIEENASIGLLKGTRVTNKKTGNSVFFQRCGPYFLEKASERPAVLFLPDYRGTLEYKLKELNKILQLLKEHLK